MTAKSNAREGDGVAVPPEAVPVAPDGLRFGVISSSDWAIPAPCGARIVDARMAYGWNECRKEMLALQAQQGAEPVATEYAWLVENGKQVPDLRYRTIEQGIPVWTDDHEKAIRFARRADAEMFAAEDDEAWAVVQHGWHTAPAAGAPR